MMRVPRWGLRHRLQRCARCRFSSGHVVMLWNRHWDTGLMGKRGNATITDGISRGDGSVFINQHIKYGFSICQVDVGSRGGWGWGGCGWGWGLTSFWELDIFFPPGVLTWLDDIFIVCQRPTWASRMHTHTPDSWCCCWEHSFNQQEMKPRECVWSGGPKSSKGATHPHHYHHHHHYSHHHPHHLHPRHVLCAFVWLHILCQKMCQNPPKKCRAELRKEKSGSFF